MTLDHTPPLRSRVLVTLEIEGLDELLTDENIAEEFESSNWNFEDLGECTVRVLKIEAATEQPAS